jgi:hypothetical protein
MNATNSTIIAINKGVKLLLDCGTILEAVLLAPLLMAIIVLLVAFIVGGYTVNDLKNML